jgi:hypothetical protein
MGSAELVAAGHDPGLVARVIRLIDLAEYKRRQYPPGPKISQKNFGPTGGYRSRTRGGRPSAARQRTRGRRDHCCRPRLGTARSG